jgi:hypothetical protein
VDQVTFEDGTLISRDLEGPDLAFHAGRTADPAPPILPFGFGRSRRQDVRDLQTALGLEGVETIEQSDEGTIVSLKDPDGYLIEVYWEPEYA